MTVDGLIPLLTFAAVARPGITTRWLQRLGETLPRGRCRCRPTCAQIGAQNGRFGAVSARSERRHSTIVVSRLEWAGMYIKKEDTIFNLM